VGKEHSTIAAAVDRVNAAHPELGMRFVDDPWHGQYYMQSDHYSFARGGVPAIFLFNGVHPQLHTPKDEMGLIDAEKAARIVRMMFYLALDVANTTAAPAWDPAARQRVMQGGH
jgi:Zn-dependent M28 family amino/carboxypeptidase